MDQKVTIKTKEEADYPVVVVVAFERVDSLKRLMNSLANAYYDHSVRLIISIDKGNNDEVLELAQSFEWKAGQKEIICHSKNLGLKAHILACGDLTNRFSNVIVLEDDLLVSPMYYRYTEAALDYFAGDDSIGGISLYSNQFNLHTKLPFTPIIDDGDTFFIQFASSWGQAWSKDQWFGFREWYNQGQEIGEADLLPINVKNWPDLTDWMKYFNKYLTSRGKYFVYPRTSLSTNFTEHGVHFTNTADHYQVPLLLVDKQFKFKSLLESLSVYDVFFEVEKRVLDTFVPELKHYNYIVDLNGIKPLDLLPEEYVITIRPASNQVINFGFRLVPFEMNVILGIEGTGISLVEKKFIKTADNSLSKRMAFYYSFLSGKKIIKLFLIRIRNASRMLFSKKL